MAVLSIKLYLKKQMVGQICRLWFANPCSEEQGRIITHCGIIKKGGGHVEIKSVCWGMVFAPPGLPMRSQHWSVVALPKGDPVGPRCTWHLEVLHLGSLGYRDIWS